MAVYAWKISGPFGRERVTVRRFASEQDWHKFQNRQPNNDWQDIGERSDIPKAPGTYAKAGGQWRNVKGLDPLILAHI